MISRRGYPQARTPPTACPMSSLQSWSCPTGTPRASLRMLTPLQPIRRTPPSEAADVDMEMPPADGSWTRMARRRSYLWGTSGQTACGARPPDAALTAAAEVDVDLPPDGGSWTPQILPGDSRAYPRKRAPSRRQRFVNARCCCELCASCRCQVPWARRVSWPRLVLSSGDPRFDAPSAIVWGHRPPAAGAPPADSARRRSEDTCPHPTAALVCQFDTRAVPLQCRCCATSRAPLLGAIFRTTLAPYSLHPPGDLQWGPNHSQGSAMKVEIFLGAPAPSFRSVAGLAEISRSCAAWVRLLLSRDTARRPSARQTMAAGAFRSAWGTAWLQGGGQLRSLSLSLSSSGGGGETPPKSGGSIEHSAGFGLTEL